MFSFSILSIGVGVIVVALLTALVILLSR